MDNRVIDSRRSRFFCCQIFPVGKDLLEALSHSEVTAGILVKESIVEQKAAAIDRRFLWNQGDFSKHT